MSAAVDSPKESPKDASLDGGSRLELKVGAFVLGTLLLGVGMLFLLGEKKQVFEKRVPLHARFDRIEGLVEGAPVRLAGVNVGNVSRVGFAEDPNDPRIAIELEVSQAALGRMHVDSAARIGSQGLLGDKIIEISVGTPGAPLIASGAELSTVQPADFDHLIAQAGKILDDAQVVAQSAAFASKALAEPKTIRAVQGSLASIDHLLRQVQTGPGLAHALFYDPKTARETRELITHVDALAEHVDIGVKKVDEILAATDDDGKQVVNHLARAAKDVSLAATDMRVAANKVNQSRVIEHLEMASGDLAAMTHYVRSGQGTVGALLVDPTVYDKLLTVLGGVGRSRILRAMVRLAIARDGDADKGRVVSGGGLAPAPAEPEESLDHVAPAVDRQLAVPSLPDDAAPAPTQRRARRGK